jgi:DNA helicase-2/ATP-dependent DNA helicase PcrA
MNDQQKLAVTTPHRNTLVVATPGSGKTMVLVERINHLLDSGEDPAGIVAITFTNAAAGEMVQRLAAGRNEAAAQRLGYVGTLHGWLFRLLTKEAARCLVGIFVPPTIIDEDAAEELLDGVKKRLGYKGTKTALTDALRHYPARSNPPTAAELVAAEFRATMARTGMLDFDTLLDVGRDLIKIAPVGLVPVRHLLVDEAQDSSALDWEIYDAITTKTKFVVGDPDQSIYRFRGAKVELFMEHFNSPEWNVIRLERNYRCRKAICDAARKVIEQNKERAQQNMTAEHEGGAVVVSYYATRGAEDTELMGHLSQELEDESSATAILVRTNAQVQRFAALLAEHGYPLAIRKDRVFPEDWRKAKTLLAVLANPSNTEITASYLRQCGRTPAQINEARLAAIQGGTTLAGASGICVEGGQFTPHYAARVVRAHGCTAASADIVEEIAGTLPARATMGDLLISICNEETKRVMAGDMDGIRIMTMHGAKGLEFDNVVLPECDESAAAAKEPSEEDRRLFYVAMTRAKHRLTITSAGSGPNRAGREEARKALSLVPTDPS